MEEDREEDTEEEGRMIERDGDGRRIGRRKGIEGGGSRHKREWKETKG